MILIGVYINRINKKGVLTVLHVTLEKSRRIEPDKKNIVEYLKKGTEVAAAPGFVRDQVTQSRTPIALYAYSDGVFEWTSNEIYHVENYDYQLPQPFLEYIRDHIH